MIFIYIYITPRLIMKIIEHDKNYEFAFVEDLNHIVPHPVANYYLKINDLSVNLLINLK